MSDNSAGQAQVGEQVERRDANGNLVDANGQPQGQPQGDALDGMNKDELYAEAQRLEVEGRSDMNKDELLAAVRNAQQPQQSGQQPAAQASGQVNATGDLTVQPDPAAQAAADEQSRQMAEASQAAALQQAQQQPAPDPNGQDQPAGAQQDNRTDAERAQAQGATVDADGNVTQGGQNQ